MQTLNKDTTLMTHTCNVQMH